MAEPTRTLHGQLELRFLVRDRGVSHYTSSIGHLQFELVLDANGTATLTASGRTEVKASFLDHTGPRDTTHSTYEIADRWVGHARRRGAVTLVELDKVRKSDTDAPGSLSLSCQREPTQARSPGIGGPLVRCTPTEHYTGMSWSDPLPHYARVPLVFAEHGDVLTNVHGDHESGAHLSSPRAPRR